MDLGIIGINKGKVTQFKNKGIHTIEDLIKFFPRKYYDFRNPVAFKNIKDGEFQSVVGKVIEIKSINKGNIVMVKIEDDSNWNMNVTYFKQPHMAKIIKKGLTYIFCGKAKLEKFKKDGKEYTSRKMDTPIEYSLNVEKCKRIHPIYSKIENMSPDFLFKSINSALAVADKTDYIEPELLRKFNILTYTSALRNIHQPTTQDDIVKAQKRFLFDDLFFYNMHLVSESAGMVTKSPFVIDKFVKAKEFMDSLPYDLTQGQRVALRTMCSVMKRGDRLNALVQGDVGCGKTTVALLLMVVGAESGYQSALMAPTNVLAEQHYKEAKKLLEPLGFKVGVLSGEQTAKERRAVIAGLKSGEIHTVVGTHSLISKDVEFKNLAITIVDEEHRFGVAQRETLKNKAENGVHTVTMSATPIPRSLALSIHGDNVEVITIDTLPTGRQPVETIHSDDENKSYDMMYEEIQKGRQCYVVCPLIEDSEDGVMEGVDSVTDTYEKLQKYFKGKNIRVGMAVGGKKMTNAERTETLSKFSKGEYDILVATTIIEVGVNVPNSTVILIKNADRFGLAQLHQLRGRVGRGSHKSYCLLVADVKTENAKKKINAMCETTNGFIIAQKDLEIRGAGNFIGTQQSGDNKYVMLMLANQDFYMKIKDEVRAIFKSPARFNKYKYMLEEQYNYLLGIDKED
jgi:RecG-like helicase